MRLFHKMYARLFGYFWLPCPVCTKEFGGHEIAKAYTAALVCADGRSCVVCPDPQCSHDATVLNIANGHPQYVRQSLKGNQ